MMIETDSKEKEEEKEHKQLKEEKEYEEEYNETIVTLRLPKKYYKTAYAVAHLLGHDSFDEYVSDVVIQNMQMEIGGGGSVSVDGIETEKLLGEGLFDR
jgi:hypothetical protein